MIDPKSLILKKRSGGVFSDSEIEDLIRAYTRGDVPEYQMSALLMAVVWRGMTDDETFALTRAMVESGRTLSFPDVGPTADKHSTGGVGDKVSLVLAPLAASAGAYVPMLSGRGLGHTGGTLDKLESIPGFTTRLEAGVFDRVLRAVGCVMGGQSAELAPADGKMYALRDTTGTIESFPLIVSSILSKKVAAGPDVLVLDVKVGRGAFMKTLDDATTLAELLVRTGTRFGKTVLAFITNMDVPLGRAIGNAIEVEESVALLRDERVAEDFRELTLLLTGAMLVGAGRDPDLVTARARLDEILRSGEAYRKFLDLIAAQNGDPDAIETGKLPRAAREIPIPAPADGFVADIDPLAVAEEVVRLGGGRRVMTDDVDPAVGIWLERKPGESVRIGDPVMTIRAPAVTGEPTSALEQRMQRAVRIEAEAGNPPLVYRVVGAAGSVPWEGWGTRLPL